MASHQPQPRRGLMLPVSSPTTGLRATGDRGSASLLAVGFAVVLLGGCLVGVLWAAVSIGHHRADAAADLVALSAAQVQQTAPGDACTTARRIADAQQVELRLCQQSDDSVAVVVAVPLHLGALGTPVVTGEARAGPIEGGHWPGDG
ncbi:Rv3654c family TadE-like protein [Kribbella catacumbae]|uniref:Rv3654c family TadE-like protein n=1 Tax=Kribbella catacumbae TaxID=460086 RepID=UPI000A051024